MMILVLSLTLLISCNNNTTENNKTAVENNYTRMIMIDDQLYEDTGYINSALTCGTADGKILSSVERNETPKKNNESNFGEGYAYQRWEKTQINVNIDRKWYIFRSIAVSFNGIPNSVAHFVGEVTEVSDDRLLVAITSLPEEFEWIFEFQKANVIKPISLNIEDLNHEKAEDLIGKKVEVWFDGQTNSEESEITIKLGEVYKINILEKDANFFRRTYFFVKVRAYQFLTTYNN